MLKLEAQNDFEMLNNDLYSFFSDELGGDGGAGRSEEVARVWVWMQRM